MARRLQGRVVIATHNPGKLREMEELLAPHGVQAVPAAALGLAEPEETGASFSENARIKARAAAQAARLPALADDSGLVVDALGGAPGIHSARLAGPDKDFSRAMRVIQEKLSLAGATTPEQRRAAFVSALALAWPDGHEEVFEGRVEGALVWPPRGANGFGYDPMFLPDGHARTFGEMSAEEKHGLPPRGAGLSHRARAFLALAAACLDQHHGKSTMQKRKLGRTGIEIAPLVLGGNVFGWTADEKTSFAVLDAFVAEGFTAVDTANSYSRWVPGHRGGESETIIGKWMKARGNRDRVQVFTKVGSDMGQGRKDLSAAHIAQAAEDSLRRLQTDHIDVYFSHWPDETVAQEETLGAYAKLIAAGKVRAIGCSNYDGKLLCEALKLAADKGLPRYEVLQNEYNLYSRDRFEGAVQEIVVREGLGSVPYYGLASGFLTGKYRSQADLAQSPRGRGVAKYLDEKGMAILAALDAVAKRTGAAPAEIALAWLAAQPGVTAPIASATSVAQVESLARGARLALSADELRALTEAGY